MGAIPTNPWWMNGSYGYILWTGLAVSIVCWIFAFVGMIVWLMHKKRHGTVVLIYVLFTWLFTWSKHDFLLWTCVWLPSHVIIGLCVHKLLM